VLVAGLLRHLARTGAGEAPQVVQTPISTVILAGDLAWKLKRPVRLPFLDFSTRARRQFFCQEELRINQRTAPQLYLDVQPVTGPLEAPVIGGPGEPLDWLLRMRRFAAGGEFRVLARSGQLQAAQVQALAQHLAQFHLGLAPVDAPARAAAGGQPFKTVWDWSADSLNEIATHPARPATCPLAAVNALRALLAQRLAQQAPVLAQRQADGFVREGHGDLHLGNLVLWQGAVLAFDAIEFDARLRCIDIVHDVAFTFMDLLALGPHVLAWHFINVWAEGTGDYAGLPLLHAFAASRALVRAKVALFQGDVPAFTGYWALAARLARPPAVPRLVLVMGLSGSGKSTVAQALAQRLGAVRLRSDVERKRLAGLAPTGRPAPGSDLYSPACTRRTYDRLGALAQILLAGGLSVVVDAALLRQHERQCLRELARHHGAAFALVQCVAPAALLQARIQARAQAGDDPSDATLAVLALQQHTQEPVPDDGAPGVFTLLNDASLDVLRARIDALVATWELQKS
jgi:aminoglycoside phosphotransferase family enzyme/predicted kinase